MVSIYIPTSKQDCSPLRQKTFCHFSTKIQRRVSGKLPDNRRLSPNGDACWYTTFQFLRSSKKKEYVPFHMLRPPRLQFFPSGSPFGPDDWARQNSPRGKQKSALLFDVKIRKAELLQLQFLLFHKSFNLFLQLFFVGHFNLTLPNN